MNQALMDFEQSPRISKEGFAQISKYVNNAYGINLSEAKQNLVENRLYRRLKFLRMNSYSQYIRHIFEPAGKQELELLCDLLSTNKTYFYREPAHFHFLQNLLGNAPGDKSWKVWSAASSAGDEVYTVSCIFEDARRIKPLHYTILGTDISSRMIDEANVASYPYSRIKLLPSHHVKNYFIKTEDDREGVFYSAGPVIRKNVRFQQFNLIRDIPALSEKFDIIFCRNVLIYFKEEMKQQVVKDLISKLKPGGYLMLGHCEGMLCRNTGLKQIGPAIFLNDR